MTSDGKQCWIGYTCQEGDDGWLCCAHVKPPCEGNGIALLDPNGEWDGDALCAEHLAEAGHPMSDDEAHEATLRVLYHVVSTYQEWRDQRLSVPNEFTDDAARIGEERLREIGWWPPSGG